ncbi:hypothetical protein [Arthrobacter sp. A2-55]|uniref:hypothetical protein n=1 Tax=Arthrobacter sp. A2-55 TaxID=2897337 RepID=UPI0021CD5FE8|nr:hypothetical protein [Arthrobacter sp. A2-55]MCU6479271.1 hypothetical protein [Arthrobacter sp. A2-55]
MEHAAAVRAAAARAKAGSTAESVGWPPPNSWIMWRLARARAIARPTAAQARPDQSVTGLGTPIRPIKVSTNSWPAEMTAVTARIAASFTGCAGIQAARAEAASAVAANLAAAAMNRRSRGVLLVSSRNTR